MRQTIFLLITLLLLTVSGQSKAQDITFRAVAPEAVVMGEQFRLVFTVNAEGRELRAPDMSDFRVLMGPSNSTNRSISIVNGQSTSVVSQTYTYILMAEKEGTFNLAPATIRINNSNYTSNSLVIKVLPPDQTVSPSTTQGDANNSGTSTGTGNNDLFVRTIVSNRSVYEQ